MKASFVVLALALTSTNAFAECWQANGSGGHSDRRRTTAMAEAIEYAEIAAKGDCRWDGGIPSEVVSSEITNGRFFPCEKSPSGAYYHCTAKVTMTCCRR